MEKDARTSACGLVQPTRRPSNRSLPLPLPPAGSFGELALLYNCPRAASVTAETPGAAVWALDRGTFRTLVVGAMGERRERCACRRSALHSFQLIRKRGLASDAPRRSAFGAPLWAWQRGGFAAVLRALTRVLARARRRREAFLRGSPTFRGLTASQLAAVADCLAGEAFDPGEGIIAQGEDLGAGAKFYVLEEGRVDCFRTHMVRGGEGSAARRPRPAAGAHRAAAPSPPRVAKA